jgi:hypothetical protein
MYPLLLVEWQIRLLMEQHITLKRLQQEHLFLRPLKIVDVYS